MDDIITFTKEDIKYLLNHISKKRFVFLVENDDIYIKKYKEYNNTNWFYIYSTEVNLYYYMKNNRVDFISIKENLKNKSEYKDIQRMILNSEYTLIKKI